MTAERAFGYRQQSMFPGSRLAAEAIRRLPQKRISRVVGKAAAAPLPTPLVRAAVDAFSLVLGVDLDEAAEPAGGYRSFDDFFARPLKEGARPLDPDPSAVLCPADGKIESIGAITPAAQYRVKGRDYSISELLEEAGVAVRYAGGAYAIVYLSPRDYHRVHAPVSGPVARANYVPGALHPVNEIGVAHIPGIFAVNERVSTVQTSASFGDVTTVMVGAIIVGSIEVVYDELHTRNARGESEPRAGLRDYGGNGAPLDRGGPLGTFHLGSTAIVFVPPLGRDEHGNARHWQLEASAGAKVRVGQALFRAVVGEGG